MPAGARPTRAGSARSTTTWACSTRRPRPPDQGKATSYLGQAASAPRDVRDVEKDLAEGELRAKHYTYALFISSPKPPPPGTMYCFSSSPRSLSQKVPGTVLNTSSGESPRSSRSA